MLGERCGYAGDYTVRFMHRDDWMKCAAEGGREEVLERMKGCSVYLGSDYSEVSDLSASCFFAIDEHGVGLILPYHFIPETVVGKLDALTRGKVAAWIADGWLEPLPAGPTMPETVAKRTLELLEPLPR